MVQELLGWKSEVRNRREIRMGWRGEPQEIEDSRQRMNFNGAKIGVGGLTFDPLLPC